MVKFTATAHWNEIAGDIIYSLKYPFVKTKSDNIQSTSVSTNVPIMLVPANLTYLTKIFSMQLILSWHRIDLRIVPYVIPDSRQVHKCQYDNDQDTYIIQCTKHELVTA